MKRSILIAFLLLSIPGLAQITLDSGSPQNSGSQTVASYSFNLTIGAGCSNSMLEVAIGIDDAGTPATVNSVSYNSVALTQIRSDNFSNGLRADHWRLLNPTHDGAAHSVSVTLSGAPTTNSLAAAYGFCGVNQSTPVDVQNGANGNSASASVSITTTVNNDWYVAIVCAPSTPITFSNGETLDASVTNEEAIGHKGPIATGATTPSATIGAGGGIWTISVVAFEPSGGAAAAVGISKTKKLDKLN